MSKFTSTLALALVAMGMNAQVTVPSLTNGKLLTAEQLNQMNQPKKIAIYLAHQKQKNTWYVGKDDSNNGKTMKFSSEVVFYWEGNTTNGHSLKKAFDTPTLSGYLAAANPNTLTPDASAAAKFDVVTPKKDGTGNAATIWDDSCPTDNDPNNVNLTRFVNHSNTNKWINSNQTNWNDGKGAWTMFYVFDMTDYNLVTIKETKEGTTTEKKEMYKTGDNIVITQYPGYTSSISEVKKDDKENQVVEINYTKTTWKDRAKATVAEAQKLVAASNAKKVGYPTDATALQAAISTLDAAKDSVTFYSVFNKALSDYKSDLKVNLPEDGKAYKIEAVYPNGTALPIYYNDNEGVKRIFNGNSPALNDTIFVCHKVGEKYLLVNNRGQYLIWFDSDNTSTKPESVNGFLTTYNEKYNWTLQRADLTHGEDFSVQQGTTLETLFGLLMMQGVGKDNTTYYLNTNSNGNFVSGRKDGKWYDTTGNDQRTFAFRFTEVTYANEVDLKEITGNTVKIAGASSIATFSAPFATTIPADVTAYYVAQNGVQGNVATLTQVTGTIPANTGVILTGTEVKNVTMVPATEAGTTIANNQLGNSAGAAKDLSKETNFYILGKGSNGQVGFFKGATTSGATLAMNKAYLKADAAAQAIQLQFGGETTGIEAVEGVQQTNAAIFDLSGRRVFQTVKGGLYIQNGKKFIAQ